MALVPLSAATDIERLQQFISSFPQPSFKEHTRHYFADGMYLRELFRPAGTLIVGKVHKKEHFYIVLSGEVSVLSKDHREQIKAPRIIVSSPGTKRAVYAHEDSICITVHCVSSRDLEEIERELVEEDITACYGPGNVLKNPLIKEQL